jgi:rhamnogalacturonan acetylesterase
MKFIIIGIVSLSIANFVNAACISAYGQCGGKNFKGETCCVSGYVCKETNEWYAQCVPETSNKSSNGNNTGTKKFLQPMR